MASKAASSKGPGKSDGAVCVVLPEDARLAGLDAVLPQLREAAQASVAQLDARAVDRIDSALPQLLVAFRRAAVAAGCAVSWVGASDALREAVVLLGLDTELDLPASQPA